MQSLIIPITDINQVLSTAGSNKMCASAVVAVRKLDHFERGPRLGENQLICCGGEKKQKRKHARVLARKHTHTQNNASK